MDEINPLKRTWARELFSVAIRHRGRLRALPRMSLERVFILQQPMRDDPSLLDVALGDGRFLIALTGIALVLSGGFAILQSVSGQLLPQDSHAIGMDSAALMRVANPRLLGFMFHDRVAYGGTLVSIGTGYLWLAAFPMQTRAAWAWWALVFRAASDFSRF
jgi:hypothetical protein